MKQFVYFLHPLDFPNKVDTSTEKVDTQWIQKIGNGFFIVFQ